MEIPSVMDRVAPKSAPDDIPVVYGSARGFFMRLCMAAPAEASPAPAIIAVSALGRRCIQTTLSIIGSVVPPVMCAHRAPYTSVKPTGYSPRDILAPNSTISRMASVPRRTMPLLADASWISAIPSSSPSVAQESYIGRPPVRT